MLGSLKEKIGFLQEGISSTVRVRGLARPVDPHSFLADPDQAGFFYNSDPDPAALSMRIRLLKTL